VKRTVTRTGLMAAAALGVLLAGCTHDNQTPNTLPTSAAPASASPSPSASPSAAAETEDQAKQHATDAYVGMWNAFLKASELGDPAYAELPKYTNGVALTRLTDGLKANKANGLLGRGKSVFHPRVESLSPPTTPTKASIRDCMDTSKTELYKADGSPYKDTPGGLRLVLADVERINGVWKVTSFGVREVGSCTV
jgi:hypothetical protein